MSLKLQIEIDQLKLLVRELTERVAKLEAKPKRGRPRKQVETKAA